jgi:hypothetical protein
VGNLFTFRPQVVAFSVAHERGANLVDGDVVWYLRVPSGETPIATLPFVEEAGIFLSASAIEKYAKQVFRARAR